MQLKSYSPSAMLILADVRLKGAEVLKYLVLVTDKSLNTASESIIKMLFDLSKKYQKYQNAADVTTSPK